MNAEIITVGTELLLGDILNSNSQFLSQQLAVFGIPVLHQSTVGDNNDRLRQELEQAIADGAITMNELKRWTRAGMGLCQGKTCAKQVMAILAQKTGQKPADILPPTTRNPVRPMRIGCMTKEEDKS